MRLVVALASLFALSQATVALADSYSWAGSSGRFHVSVWLSGFNDGAGAGGWDESSARDFATWAARMNAVIPRGGDVTMNRGVSDDATRLVMRRGGQVVTVVMPDGPDFAAALPIVASHFGAAIPATTPPPRLYTLQLFASRANARAQSFVVDLANREVIPEGSFFSEACHPCTIPAARVLGPDGAGIFRVIAGIYDRREAAERALARLRRDFNVTGFVRVLP